MKIGEGRCQIEHVRMGNRKKDARIGRKRLSRKQRRNRSEGTQQNTFFASKKKVKENNKTQVLSLLTERCGAVADDHLLAEAILWHDNVHADDGEERSEALVEPDVVPPLHRDQVAEPLVGKFVGNHAGDTLAARGADILRGQGM